jgi:7-cyano-7-deazaguanine synthase in queuosine biosynthesis
VERVRAQVGTDRVICGLSGGVDSAVAAALIARAVHKQLTCIFVDNGLLRKNERELVESAFRNHFDAELRVVDASDAFLSDLKGITRPNSDCTARHHLPDKNPVFTRTNPKQTITLDSTPVPMASAQFWAYPVVFAPEPLRKETCGQPHKY